MCGMGPYNAYVMQTIESGLFFPAVSLLRGLTRSNNTTGTTGAGTSPNR